MVNTPVFVGSRNCAAALFWVECKVMHSARPPSLLYNLRLPRQTYMKFALFNNFLGPGVRVVTASLFWAVAKHLEKTNQKSHERNLDRIRFASSELRVSILLVD